MKPAANSPEPPAPSSLVSYSQFGEDVLLWRHFGGKPDGFFVEVGANHPTKFSQTWLFEQRGWSGILVEPLAAKCELLRSQRPRSQVVHAAVGAPADRGRALFHVSANDDMLSSLEAPPDGAGSTEEVEVRTLDDVLAGFKPPTVDLLSIDVEGIELRVLQGFSLERYRPSVLLLEDHLHHLKLHRYVVRRGYRLVKRTGCNNWYVPAAEKFNLASLTERLQLWKEIQLDTPVRMVRLGLKRYWHRKPR